MRKRFLCFLPAVLLATSLISQQPTAEPEGAEYAMRWNIEEGGPRSAKKVLKAPGIGSCRLLAASLKNGAFDLSSGSLRSLTRLTKQFQSAT